MTHDKVRLCRISALPDDKQKYRKVLCLNDEFQLVPGERDNLQYGRYEVVEVSMRKLFDGLRAAPLKDLAFYTAGTPKVTTGVIDLNFRRTAENFPFPEGPGLLVIDSDKLNKFGLNTPEDVVRVLREKLGIDADMVTSSSASSYLREDFIGAASSELRGLHTFVPIDKGSEAARVLEVLHRRAWLHGYGRIEVSASGSPLDRSIVDLAMQRSNQPIFEHGAIVRDPLRQERRVAFHEGHAGLLCSAAFSLSDEEEREYKRLVEAAKAEKKAEADETKERWLDAKAARFPVESRAVERARLAAQLDEHMRDLAHNDCVTLNDYTEVAVSEILADPERFPHRMMLRDPFEPGYAPSRATLFREGQSDGFVKIISHAHGFVVTYRLHPDEQAQSAAAFEEWGARIAVVTDPIAIGRAALPTEIAGDARLLGVHRDLLATKIVERFKALNGKSSPYTLTQIKRWLTPTPDSDGEMCLTDQLAVVMVGGKAVVLDLEAANDRENTALPMMTVQGARDFYKDKKVWVPNPNTGAPEKRDMFDEWLADSATVRYRGIEFDPNGGRPGFYNLWKGFATEPVPGDCSLFLEHIRDVICNGNAEAFDWVLNWLADMVQNPGRKPGTALVLRGGEGAGKGTAFANQIQMMIGPRLFAKVSNIEQIVGKFNSHLAGRLMIFANEAVWGGDPSKEGVLKDLITEETQFIEPKGVDRVEVKDFARLLFATNEDWAVPVGPDARRYTVLDVSNRWKDDVGYFARLYHQLNNGGRAAFMHLLMTRDLSGFVVQRALKTEALLDLKLMKLGVAERWLYEELCRRCVDEEADTALEQDTWPRMWEKKSMFDAYLAYAKSQSERNPKVSSRFSKWLCDLIPGVRSFRPSKRSPHYVLPNLDTCRKAFERYIGHALDWE